MGAEAATLCQTQQGAAVKPQLQAATQHNPNKWNPRPQQKAYPLDYATESQRLLAAITGQS